MKTSLTQWWMARKETVSHGNFPFPFLCIHTEKKPSLFTWHCHWILQICIKFASLYEHKGTRNWMSQHGSYMFVNPCPHSMAEITKGAWFPYLIYWVIWKEAIQESWVNFDVTVAWLSRNNVQEQCPGTVAWLSRTFPSVSSSAF